MKFALVIVTMVSFMIGWTATGCLAAPITHIELGPGVFTTWGEEEQAVASGVSSYAGAGVYLGDKLSTTARLFFRQGDDQVTTLTSLWGFLNYFPGGNAGGAGAYLSVGVGTGFDGSGKFAAHGGYAATLFSDDEGNPEVLAFLEAEGRVVNETDVESEAQANLGLRGNFGHR